MIVPINQGPRQEFKVSFESKFHKTWGEASNYIFASTSARATNYLNLIF